MSNSRAMRVACWIALIVSSLASIIVIGLATGTNVFSLDAWNSTWNDEQRYYRTVQQMRLLGEPLGVAGYNEVPALRPSYGPYSIFVYIPYYLGSFLTGFTSHNFIYVINIAFGVIACALIVLVLRPDARQSLLCAALFFFQFIIVRYMSSGMTEASYVLFAAIFVCLAMYVERCAVKSQKRKLVVVCYVLMILAIGFWGLMRPYILAFMLVPWLMLSLGKPDLGRGLRAVLFCMGVVVAAASIGVYMYLSKYYATPYFYSPTIANDFFDRIGRALPGLAQKHVECILYSCAKLVQLKWQGIMTFTFALCWVILLVCCIRAFKQGYRNRAALLLGLVLAGLAIFEAHMLMYNYRQMHRTMLSCDVVYLIAVIWYASGAIKGSKVTPRVLAVAATCVLCIVCLAVKPGEFAYPQYKDSHPRAEEATLQEELARIMPLSDDDPWANTISHPVENRSLYLYFNVPIHMSLNSWQMDKLERALEGDGIQSKYLSVPDDYEINDALRSKYKVVYEGNKHIIYLMYE